MLLIEPETIDDIFDNQLIKSNNTFTSEDVNVMIETIRVEVKEFVKGKIHVSKR